MISMDGAVTIVKCKNCGREWTDYPNALNYAIQYIICHICRDIDAKWAEFHEHEAND